MNKLSLLCSQIELCKNDILISNRRNLRYRQKQSSQNLSNKISLKKVFNKKKKQISPSKILKTSSFVRKEQQDQVIVKQKKMSVSQHKQRGKTELKKCLKTETKLEAYYQRNQNKMNALNMKFSHEPFQSESQKVQEKVQLAETSEETQIKYKIQEMKHIKTKSISCESKNESQFSQVIWNLKKKQYCNLYRQIDKIRKAIGGEVRKNRNTSPSYI